jgi:hypothetical protein
VSRIAAALRERGGGQQKDGRGNNARVDCFHHCFGASRFFADFALSPSSTTAGFC